MTSLLLEYFWPLFFFTCVAIIAFVAWLRRKVERRGEVRRSVRGREEA